MRIMNTILTDRQTDRQTGGCMSLLRRRMMMETRPTQDWDIVWNYTMGLLENNGFDILIESKVSIKETENGIEIIPSNTASYVRYIPKNYEICNEGILEVVLHIKSLPINSGFRMMLSNGVANSLGANIEALQIYVNSFEKNSVKYQIVEYGNIISDITLNTEYIFRIERRDGVNYVYLNGEKIKESTDSVSKYATENRIFFQSGGEYLLKSIKFKKIS